MARKQEILDLVEKYYPTANQENKDMVKEYLDNATDLSPQTIKQYDSAGRIWVSYINAFCKNKHLTEVKPIEFQKYLNYLYNLGIFEANIKLKRSFISSLNEYIILFYGDDYPTFRNFVTKGIKTPVTGKKFTKEPLTDEEYDNLCKYLEEKEDWEKLAYLKFTYVSGCRKNETAQVLKEVVKYSPIISKIKLKQEDGTYIDAEAKKYKTNPIKCKGKKSAELRKLSFDEDTLTYLNKWLEVRGEDDCPYMFISGRGENARKPSVTIFNDWCELFAKIIGRRIHPHLLRCSRATSLALQGKSIEAIQKLLGHKSSETTKIYIVKDDDEEEDELFVE